MIERDLTAQIKAAADRFPVVTLTGPRQSGKSTLCKMVFPDYAYANLELPDLRLYAQEDPRAFLKEYANGAIIDEIQRCPELLSYLQVMVDEDPRAGQWILTGSQNLMLLDSVSQSLAGRTAILHLLPLTYNEICRFPSPPSTLEEILLAGGYPRIFDQNILPADWLNAYVATYVERDVRSISRIEDLVNFQRFIGLCAGRTAQLLNYSALAGDAGISQPTAKSWLSILETSFLACRVPPLHANINKRLIKMPKLHFYDSGLVCWLLGIRNADQLRHHPLKGAIFETWVLSEIIKHRQNQGEQHGVHFYRDRWGTEADVVIEQADRRMLIETKAGQTIASGMAGHLARIAAELPSPPRNELLVVYGGDTRQPRSDVLYLPWKELHTHPWAS